MMSLDAALTISLVLTILGFVAACARLILGPSRADRVVALDLLTILMVAISALLAVAFDQAAYLDAGLALALVGFLATVAFARYIESEPASDTPESHTNKPDKELMQKFPPFEDDDSASLASRREGTN